MAILKILTLRCERQEDWTGDDDIYMTIDGGDGINMGRFDDKQGRTYDDKVFPFDDWAEIGLYEHDTADPDDLLGKHKVTSDEVGKKEKVNFSNMGASYDLVYIVTGTEAETTSQALVTSESKSGSSRSSRSSGGSGGHDKPPKHER